ncbi:type VII secretion protein [Streptomyces sp. NPDC047028]|uniref:nucleotide-binding protein n=1 Tax=Streptomyces sp. NPDC047028 TaxID=3155793 RepID=UPI003406148D
MTTSGRWQDDVLRELTAESAVASGGASGEGSPVDARPALPVRHADEERPHPGQPCQSHPGQPQLSGVPGESLDGAIPAAIHPDQDPPVAPIAGPVAPPAPIAGPAAPPTPIAGPAAPLPPAPPAAVPGLPADTATAQSPGTPASPPDRATAPHPAAVRPSHYPQLRITAPEPVPTLDPRLAIALGSPPHGDSLARRSGRSLRKLTSSATREVAEESRLGGSLQQPVTTGRVIAVTSIRGGVGKTTTAALLARAFSHYRHDPVLALEADAALGTLAVRMGAQSVRWSCPDLARLLSPSMRLTDVTGYLVPVADGGWLLPAGQGRVGAPLEVATYRTVTLALRRYFAVTVVDCETLPGEVARTAMDTAHARVVVAPRTAEGVGGTRLVLDWLGGLPHAALASTVVVLTANTPDTNLDLKAATGHLRETGAALVHLPYDRHLAGGGQIRTDRLGEATRRAVTEIAAEALQRAVRVR